ncbi:hypothetical protein ACR3K2_31770, partial [Cryptosporidium serpentis]
MHFVSLLVAFSFTSGVWANGTEQYKGRNPNNLLYILQNSWKSLDKEFLFFDSFGSESLKYISSLEKFQAPNTSQIKTIILSPKKSFLDILDKVKIKIKNDTFAVINDLNNSNVDIIAILNNTETSINIWNNLNKDEYICQGLQNMTYEWSEEFCEYEEFVDNGFTSNDDHINKNKGNIYIMEHKKSSDIISDNEKIENKEKKHIKCSCKGSLIYLIKKKIKENSSLRNLKQSLADFTFPDLSQKNKLKESFKNKISKNSIQKVSPINNISNIPFPPLHNSGKLYDIKEKNSKPEISLVSDEKVNNQEILPNKFMPKTSQIYGNEDIYRISKYG